MTYGAHTSPGFTVTTGGISGLGSRKSQMDTSRRLNTLTHCQRLWSPCIYHKFRAYTSMTNDLHTPSALVRAWTVDIERSAEIGAFVQGLTQRGQPDQSVSLVAGRWYMHAYLDEGRVGNGVSCSSGHFNTSKFRLARSKVRGAGKGERVAIPHWDL